MTPLLERLPAGGRIAVVRLRSLGDCVLTTPALQILKECRPDLSIAVVVEPRFQAVFKHNPCVDRILPPLVRAVAAWRPDLVINLHGGTRSIVLTAASRARFRAGFQHYRARWAYNIILPRAQEVLGIERKVHTAEHLASAMFYLGAPRCEIPRASLYAEPWDHDRPYALMHPFASAPDKAWPDERFREVAHALWPRLETLILCGPDDDPSEFPEYRVIWNVPLWQVKSIIKSAALFVGNDSGPAHMAAALGVPLVVLFGASDSVVWAPWKPVAAETLVRQPITDIATADVLQAIERMKVRA